MKEEEDPLFLGLSCVKGDVPSKRPPPCFREEKETINLNSSASSTKRQYCMSE